MVMLKEILYGDDQSNTCWCYSGRCLLVLLIAMLAGATQGDACWCYSGRCLLVLLRAMLAGATQGDACWCYLGRCIPAVQGRELLGSSVLLYGHLWQVPFRCIHALGNFPLVQGSSRGCI